MLYKRLTHFVRSDRTASYGLRFINEMASSSPQFKIKAAPFGSDETTLSKLRRSYVEGHDRHF